MNEELIRFSDVPHHIPGRPPNLSTIWRWRQRGVAGVKLQVRHIGGRVYVSPNDLARFFEYVQAAKERRAPSSRPNRQRDKAIEAAERELAEDGF